MKHLLALMALTLSAPAGASVVSTGNTTIIPINALTQTREDTFMFVGDQFREWYSQAWTNVGPTAVVRVTIDIPEFSSWNNFRAGIFGYDVFNFPAGIINPLFAAVDDGDGTGSWTRVFAMPAGSTAWIRTEAVLPVPLDVEVTIAFGREGGVVTIDPNIDNPGDDTTGVDAPIPIPLPAAGWLLAAGLGSFAVLRRRS